MARSLPRRLALLLVVLLLMWAALVAVLAWRAAQQQESEVLQRMSHGLAAHIVEHWPELGAGAPEDPQAHKELLRMLMTVNPGIQVYVLDRDARVQTYIGEPGMVRQPQMDRVALQRFLDGAPLPLYGTNPMGGASPGSSARRHSRRRPAAARAICMWCLTVPTAAPCWGVWARRASGKAWPGRPRAACCLRCWWVCLPCGG